MIVAFTGKAGAGKTTASDYLVKEFGFVKVNFKDGLIEEMKVKLPDVLRELANLYFVTSPIWVSKFKDREPFKDELIDLLFTEKPAAMRALMQNYGTEVVRGYDEDHWVNKWKEKVSGVPNVVVDDCRFLNEAEAIKSLGGLIIKVERPDYVEYMKHQSETEMDKINYDYRVKSRTNGHSKLFEQVREIVENQNENK